MLGGLVLFPQNVVVVVVVQAVLELLRVRGVEGLLGFNAALLVHHYIGLLVGVLVGIA